MLRPSGARLLWTNDAVKGLDTLYRRVFRVLFVCPRHPSTMTPNVQNVLFWACGNASVRTTEEKNDLPHGSSPHPSISQLLRFRLLGTVDQMHTGSHTRHSLTTGKPDVGHPSSPCLPHQVWPVSGHTWACTLPWWKIIRVSPVGSRPAIGRGFV